MQRLFNKQTIVRSFHFAESGRDFIERFVLIVPWGLYNSLVLENIRSMVKHAWAVFNGRFNSARGLNSSV